MRLLILVMFLSLIYIVSSKSNVKTLTESMGQEVIEIGNPIKELPIGLEEEPSGDNDDDDEKMRITSNTLAPITKKESKKTTTLAEMKKNIKDIEKIDGMSQVDEEARIEKELAEIYKDTADYKTDSSEEKDNNNNNNKEIINETTTTNKEELEYPSKDDITSAEDIDKPIERQRNNFKFQPDTTDKAGIERFRTSIDDINCNNKLKLALTDKPPAKVPMKNNAFDTVSHGVIYITAVLCCIFICN